MKIIGIDPGLAATGIGIVEGTRLKIAAYRYGSIETPKDRSLAERLDMIFSRLFSVLEAEAPEMMIVEDVFSLKENPKSGILLGKVSGVVILAGQRSRIPVVEIPVREAKQVLTGNGRASKEQLETAVRRHLDVRKPIRPLHASDAMALALIGLYRSREGVR
jgi:crossover junction endodeoxyribonuclease RuvC